MNANIKKSLSRLVAVQALFDIEASGRPFKKVAAEMSEMKLETLLDSEALGVEVEIEKIHISLFNAILEEVITSQIRIDSTTNEILMQSWSLQQIDPILRAIFRAAGAEFILGKTPFKVIINEYMNVSRAFNDDTKTTSFVNAVLDKLDKQLSKKEP